MEHTSSSLNLHFFPQLSDELRPLKDSIEIQLRELEHFLADYEWFLLLKTQKSARTLTGRFLEIVCQYLNETLPDLFESIERIHNLAETYNHGFDVFLTLIPRTILEVEACIGYVKALLDKHLGTICQLSDLAQEINRQISVFKEKASSHIEGLNAVKTTSIGMIVGGLATSASASVRALSAIQLVCVQPAVALAALGASLIVSGGSIATIATKYHETEVKTYTDAIQQLRKIEICRSEFESPIQAISDKLSFCRLRLERLQKKTNTVVDTNESLALRRSSYNLAREEAQATMSLCDEMQQHTSRITALTSLLNFRAKQLAEH
ncbi:hypothetical protein BGZ73_004644 [Actinomortierella ambigua]|nr:hypothetical protein BGZ73_004644 [Actinomortierella ambigua]